MRRARRKRIQGGSHTRWGWFPLALILLLLVLAPVLAHGQTADTVVVRWTAPGDDGHVGTAALYELRLSQSPITAANFAAALAVTGVPAPAPAGSSQSVTVRGLTPGVTYYIAARTQDDAGNWSPISNIARWDWILDAAPPGAPSGVQASRDGDVVRVRWDASPEADLAGYRVYRAVQTAGPFSLISGGTITTNELADPVPAHATTVWYEISAVDIRGNESARSTRVAFSLSTTVTASAEVKVEGSFPNPSRIDSPVTIPVVVPASGVTDAVVEILDSGQRRVRRIELGNLGAGRQDLTWDGKNDAGQTCAPGVYRGWLVTNQGRQAIRVVRVP